MEALSVKTSILILWRELAAINETIIFQDLFHAAFYDFANTVQRKNLAIMEPCHFITTGTYPYSQELRTTLWTLTASGTGYYGTGGIYIHDIRFDFYARRRSMMDDPLLREAARTVAEEYRKKRLTTPPRSA